MGLDVEVLSLYSALFDSRVPWLPHLNNAYIGLGLFVYESSRIYNLLDFISEVSLSFGMHVPRIWLNREKNYLPPWDVKDSLYAEALGAVTGPSAHGSLGCPTTSF